jgi:hypothetical protein
MTKQQSTATIYQFPKRARPSSGSCRHATKASAPQAAAANYPAVEFGRAWYHEAAVEQEDEVRECRHRQH